VLAQRSGPANRPFHTSGGEKLTLVVPRRQLTDTNSVRRSVACSSLTMLLKYRACIIEADLQEEGITGPTITSTEVEALILVPSTREPDVGRGVEGELGKFATRHRAVHHPGRAQRQHVPPASPRCRSAMGVFGRPSHTAADEIVARTSFCCRNGLAEDRVRLVLFIELGSRRTCRWLHPAEERVGDEAGTPARRYSGWTSARFLIHEIATRLTSAFTVACPGGCHDHTQFCKSEHHANAFAERWVRKAFEKSARQDL